MELLGTYGNLLQHRMRSRGAALTTEVVDTTVTAVAAGVAGYASAKSNLKGKGGKIASMPIPLAGALVLGGLAAAGVAGDASHHLMSAAKGCLAAQATMAGIKQAYQGTNQPAVVAALPQPNLAYFPPYAVHAGMPRMGATPATEAMFARAGLQSVPQMG